MLFHSFQSLNSSGGDTAAAAAASLVTATSSKLLPVWCLVHSNDTMQATNASQTTVPTHWRKALNSSGRDTAAAAASLVTATSFKLLPVWFTQVPQCRQPMHCNAVWFTQVTAQQVLSWQFLNFFQANYSQVYTICYFSFRNLKFCCGNT